MQCSVMPDQSVTGQSELSFKGNPPALDINDVCHLATITAQKTKPVSLWLLEATTLLFASQKTS